MKSSLRSIERYLIVQILQIRLQPVADNFAQRCAHAIDNNKPFPDIIDLIQNAVAARVPVLAIAPVDNYLQNCQRKREYPDPDTIVHNIVFGLSLARPHLPPR